MSKVFKSDNPEISRLVDWILTEFSPVSDRNRTYIAQNDNLGENAGGTLEEDEIQFRLHKLSDGNWIQLLIKKDNQLFPFPLIGSVKGEIKFVDDLHFEVGAGLSFGEIYAYDSGTTITISTAGIANKVQVTSFDTNGESNNTAPDHTSNHVKVTVAGKYLCVVSISAESAGGGGADEFGFAVHKNNGDTLFQNLHSHRELDGGGGDTGSVSLSGIIALTVDDTIELWCWNEDSTDDLVIDDVTLSLVQIGK